ncbi:hypothetical protein FACS189413_03010 [Bacteroidia bacterium]|nr:hypothetical protein FACS189413_03010 [Bacteroidia bacterium]
MKNFFLIFTLIIPFVSLSAGNTLTVSSVADNGAGSLRQTITDAAGGDQILIPSGYVIELESEIVFSKSLSINGQDASIRVKSASVDAVTHRIFNIGGYGSEPGNFTIVLENLNLTGGNVTGLQGNDKMDGNGGAIYVHVNGTVDFTMRHCTASAKATAGGVFISPVANGVKVTLEDCIFNNSLTTSRGSAAYIKAANGITIRNCVFENNESKGASAVVVFNPATVSDCYFKNNRCTSQGRGSTTFAVDKDTQGQITLDNCTFYKNTALYDAHGDGGAALSAQSPNAKVVMTNCTVYGNRGSRGAVYNYQGKIDIIHCTFAANVSANTDDTASDQANSHYGGAFANAIDYNNIDLKSTCVLVNNIFAYNYNRNEVSDVYVSTQSNREGTNNIIVRAVGGVQAITPLENRISFDTEFDALFAEYTINEENHQIPVYDEVSQTVALSSDSRAIGNGTSSYKGLAIPSVDQRGVMRGAHPCLGSREYVAGDGNKTFQSNDNPRILQNPAEGQLQIGNSEKALRLEILDLAGKIRLSENQPGASVSLKNLNAGIYLLRFQTPDGTSIEKLIIK